MNGQGTPLEVKMMKSPAEECGAAATSRPWEMKTAVTRTPAPSLLPKWLRAGKAISRRLSHPSQNSPLSSKCFQYSASGTPLSCFIPYDRIAELLDSRVSVANNIPQVERHDILNSLLVLTLGLTYIPVPSKTWYPRVFCIKHNLNRQPPKRVYNNPEWLLKRIRSSHQ